MNVAADLFTFGNLSLEKALKRTTHLAIGAHQDDIEIMAYHGIAQCYREGKKWFSAIVASDGKSSPRKGKYGKLTDFQMAKLRLKEQRTAAKLGQYSACIQMGFDSQDIKKQKKIIQHKLTQYLETSRPDVVYIHNPFDSHPTHVALSILCLKALRNLPEEHKPRKVFGCEVWGSLDWLDDSVKVFLDTSKYPQLAKQLLSIFKSQISGGKRYDLAALGRRKANATFSHSHETDRLSEAVQAVDLTKVIFNRSPINRFMREHLLEFKRRALKAAEGE